MSRTIRDRKKTKNLRVFSENEFSKYDKEYEYLMINTLRFGFVVDYEKYLLKMKQKGWESFSDSDVVLRRKKTKEMEFKSWARMHGEGTYSYKMLEGNNKRLNKSLRSQNKLALKKYKDESEDIFVDKGTKKKAHWNMYK